MPTGPAGPETICCAANLASLECNQPDKRLAVTPVDVICKLNLQRIMDQKPGFSCRGCLYAAGRPVYLDLVMGTVTNDALSQP